MRAVDDGHWEHYPHLADMGVRGFGASIAQAFEQTALAMTAVITDLDKVAAQQAVTLHCASADPELLLVDWLNALIYEMATRHMLFSRFEVHIDKGRLDATAWGEHMDIHRHRPRVEIKGATYTDLRVAQTGDRQWLAQCIVDV